MKRPKVDETLCFVCQVNKPTWKAEKEGIEQFLLCDTCKQMVQSKNYTNNQVKLALAYPENNFRIFTETLGGRAKGNNKMNSIFENETFKAVELAINLSIEAFAKDIKKGKSEEESFAKCFDSLDCIFDHMDRNARIAIMCRACQRLALIKIDMEKLQNYETK